jgi:hypothetical protein
MERDVWRADGGGEAEGVSLRGGGVRRVGMLALMRPTRRAAQLPPAVAVRSAEWTRDGPAGSGSTAGGRSMARFTPPLPPVDRSFRGPGSGHRHVFGVDHDGRGPTGRTYGAGVRAREGEVRFGPLAVALLVLPAPVVTGAAPLHSALLVPVASSWLALVAIEPVLRATGPPPDRMGSGRRRVGRNRAMPPPRTLFEPLRSANTAGSPGHWAPRRPAHTHPFRLGVAGAGDGPGGTGRPCSPFGPGSR